MYAKEQIRNACNRAINNILFEGTTDVEIFNTFFEISFLEDENTKKNIVDSITQDILNKKLELTRIKHHGKVLVPKNNLAAFRICSLTDIYDEIFYLTLVLLMSNEIEAKRLNRSEKKIYSYRFNKNKSSKILFDENFNFTSFKEEVRKESIKKGNNIIVECDIANFYDRLNLHRLESTLLSIKAIDRDAIKLLNELLLYWSHRDSYGIPVGSNASRILAEASLIEVDNYLKRKKVKFYRFVDDYRIFAKDSNEAFRSLTILIERLQLEGLFVNSSKTKIKQIVINEATETVATTIETNEAVEKNKTFEIEAIARTSEVVAATVERNESDTITEENSVGINTIKNHITDRSSLSKVIRGYSGVIPLKFRKISEKEVEKLSLLDFDKEFDLIKDEVIIEPEKIKNLIKIVVAQEKWEEITKILLLIKKFPQFTPYIIDILTKYEEHLSHISIKEIKEDFKNIILDEDTPEYIIIYLVKLFSNGAFTDKEILLDFFFNLKRNSGDYIGRAVLDALSNCKNLSRGDALQIKTYFQRADIFEKRRILYILNKHLELEERNAYFKNVGMIEKDHFILHMTDRKKDFMYPKKN
ncbi:RNA-directed DNA polymerase [Rummeliibacillus pycnus]|uniref:RNA-directed DNA polymerase n=1 Tax=Rummeliibacillus pycnus TaxID=101070 RepID=UPI003D2C987F